MLSDLIKELARVQAIMNRLKSARRDLDAESFRKELEDGNTSSWRG